jgi:tetratricopeptide (TPR) repeat protein
VADLNRWANKDMATEWYRKATWSAADREDFEAHLKRSRGVYNKSQYLRIQASHLQGAAPPLYREALSLLERVLGEWRDDSQVASALFQKAECLLELDGFDTAAPVFREGLEFETQRPNARTNAWVIFPWQIVKHQRSELFDEALRWLASSPTGSTFPVDQFRVSAVLAIVKMKQGDLKFAKSCAADAQKAAAADSSGFRYHQKLGLVGLVEPWVKAELERILAA